MLQNLRKAETEKWAELLPQETGRAIWREETGSAAETNRSC